MLAARRMMIQQVHAATPVSVPSTGVSSDGFGGRHSCTTGAFTPAANALIIIPAAIYDGGGPRTRAAITVTDTLGGLTWHEVATSWFDDAHSNSYKTAIYWAIAPSAPTSGTVTLTSASPSFVWFTTSNVVQVSAGDFTPSSPIVQSMSALIQSTTAHTPTTTHTLTATLGTVPTGAVLAVLHQAYTSNGVGVQPGGDPNFTHLDYVLGHGAVEIDIDTSDAVGQQSVTWTGLHEGTDSWWYYGLLVELQ